MIWNFLAIYVLIGFVIAMAFIMVYGDELLLSLDLLASADGIDIGPGAVLVAFTITAMLVWPFMLFSMGAE